MTAGLYALVAIGVLGAGLTFASIARRIPLFVMFLAGMTAGVILRELL
ncbi:hypothetical protein OG896_24700 [Streptomyces sp. NBC_00669]|nr:hypothetical protein [Streptomyces sp. NBC_00669]